MNEDIYVNRLNYHAINVQILCNYDSKIVNIVAKWPGSVHDSTILKESSVVNYMTRVPLHPSVILGDSGYVCSNWLLTPYRIVDSRHKEIFNNAHKSCRSKIERCIGQLKRRWPCIHGEVRMAPPKACQLIVSCAILHNLAKEFNMPDVVGKVESAGNICVNIMYKFKKYFPIHLEVLM